MFSSVKVGMLVYTSCFDNNNNQNYGMKCLPKGTEGGIDELGVQRFGMLLCWMNVTAIVLTDFAIGSPPHNFCKVCKSDSIVFPFRETRRRLQGLAIWSRNCNIVYNTLKWLQPLRGYVGPKV